MNRGSAVKNKLLTRKWAENNQRIHELKLRNMQSRVDSGRPAEFFHLKIKAKREQMLEDRFTEIERENRILLEKMSSIMNKKQNKDLGNDQRSLNTNARKLEMRRIAVENQALLKRLQEKTPSYNIQEWQEDRKRTEKRLKDICEFPYLGHRDKSTPLPRKTPRKLSPLTKSSVYKKGVAIDNKHFVVEIRRAKNFFTIFLNDIESPDSYSLKIPTKEALDLMGSSYNYEKIVNMLEMENGEVVLVDPRENRGYESAPAHEIKDPKSKTSGGFGLKPRTKEEKVIRSYDFGARAPKKVKESADEELEYNTAKGGKEMSMTGYDGFHIDTKRSSERETDRDLKEVALKMDGKKGGFDEEDESEEDLYEREDEDEESDEGLERNKEEGRGEKGERDREGFKVRAQEGRRDEERGDEEEEERGDEEEEEEERGDEEDRYSFGNESADKSVTLLKDLPVSAQE